MVLCRVPGPAGLYESSINAEKLYRISNFSVPGPRRDDTVLKPMASLKLHEFILSAVDVNPTLNGAGVTLIDATGHATDLRGGPRRMRVYISVTPQMDSAQFPPEKQLPTFWERWGSTVLSCGSTAATGVVIGLSGGTATPIVGAFALNSAALCGMSLGKAIEYDAWAEFEKNGGGDYKAWLTIETAMSLADLLSGVGGAMKVLKGWNAVGKLAKLKKAVSGEKLTRKQLLKVIQQIDPEFTPNLAKNGVGYYSKAKLVIAGKEVLAKNKFISLSNQQAGVVIDAIGNALTLAGTPDLWKALEKNIEVWVVQYSDKPELE